MSLEQTFHMKYDPRDFTQQEKIDRFIGDVICVLASIFFISMIVHMAVNKLSN